MWTGCCVKGMQRLRLCLTADNQAIVILSLSKYDLQSLTTGDLMIVILSLS